MGYTNSIDVIKSWDPNTKRLEYCSCAEFDEHDNKSGKVWSPDSELILDTLPTLKTILSYHPFIKYYIYEGNVNFPPEGTPISIVTKYCEHHNMSYISQSENNST